MKLSNNLEQALNDQLNLELASSYAYLAMAAYFAQTPYTGFAQWMEVQSREETTHAGKFFKYILERGGKVALKAIAQPKSNYTSALEVFLASLGHEQRVSAAICSLYELALSDKDYATLSFLKWFLDEQVEEERNVSDMIAKLELVGDNRNGLFQLDKLASKRGQTAK
jgi:ferritin